MKSDFIELDSFEQHIKETLINYACGRIEHVIQGENEDNSDTTIVGDYEGFCEYLNISHQKQLFDALDRIARHDFYQEDGAPMLEAVLFDLVGISCHCHMHRPEYYDLLCEFYGKDAVSGKDMDELDSREKLRVEIYYRVGKDYGSQYADALEFRHTIVKQEGLREMCLKDIAPIAYRRIHHMMTDINARCIIKDEEKPVFKTLSYGDFFFKGEQMYMLTNENTLRKYRDFDAEHWLCDRADEIEEEQLHSKDYIDEDSGELITWTWSTCAIEEFNHGHVFAIPVLFAGTRTNLHDIKTGYCLYTGDLVRVKMINRNGEEYGDYGYVAGLNVFFYSNEYCLILDNHCLLFNDIDHPYHIEKLGTVFSHIDRNAVCLNVEHLGMTSVYGFSEFDIEMAARSPRYAI